MRRSGSPYRKAEAAGLPSFRIRTSFPRRSRVVLYALLVFVVFFMLPKPELHLGRALVFLLFGSEAATTFTCRGGPAVDVLRFVNPLIGTTNGGHVFPGASLPYGMAKAVADTMSVAENAAGFVSDDNAVTGFSHMHDSGTGGNPSLGNFPLFVHPGCPGDDFRRCKYPMLERMTDRVNGSATASPGYFSVELVNGVKGEVTVSERAALYRFGFPGWWEAKEEGMRFSPLVLVDLVDLANSRSSGGIQVYPDTGRIIGDGVYAPSFGAGQYRAYFCADFRGAEIRKSGTFVRNNASEEIKWLDGTEPGWYNPGGSSGAWLQFERPERDEILARVGVSFVSVDQACENAERGIPDFGFERVHEAAREQWRKKLGAVEVEATGVSEAMQTTFWSGLYRTMLSPQNYTGENQLWNSTEPYFDSFYCIWDSFRAQHPLLTIIDAAAQTEMVRALVDIYRHEGKLPDCRMSFCKGFTQGGSNADIVLADAFVKNLTAGIDWDTAYDAVVSDAELEPKNWGVEGRGNLVSWHELGYIPWNDDDRNGTGPTSRTISRSVEYAYDDFCIGAMAEGLGRPAAETRKYRARGANWKNLWNSEQKDLFRDPGGEVLQSTFVGFLQPRLVDGSWRYHNTRTCSPIHKMHECYYDTAHDTYEGSPWLYSFFAPQDMASLVFAMGGPERFVERLTYFHTSGIAYMGNEQSFLTVFQFHYGARPGLSSYWAHEYIPSLFNASVNGIPGNDDCAMGAFSAFAYMGFFPVAGQDVYLVTPPFFPEVKVRARNGRWAVISVSNFDPTYERKYIQSAKLNGRTYTRSWITHEFFMKGGVLELVVGSQESSWGTADGDLPPSYPFVGGDG